MGNFDSNIHVIYFSDRESFYRPSKIPASAGMTSKNIFNIMIIVILNLIGDLNFAVSRFHEDDID